MLYHINIYIIYEPLGIPASLQTYIYAIKRKHWMRLRLTIHPSAKGDRVNSRHHNCYGDQF